jgi:dihydropyrimidinase
MSPRKRGILIRGGTVVTADSASVLDLLVEGETISATGRLDGVPADECVDASGLLVLPGAVDTHVHFNDSFMGAVGVHDFWTGTRAAAYGGVTSVIDFSNQKPGHPLRQTIDRKRDEAAGQALIDWGVHPVITCPSSETIAGIPDVVTAGAPTIKCYLTYRKEGLMIGFDELKTVLAALRRAGGMLLVHAEDNDALENNIPRLIRGGYVQPIYHARSRPPEVETAAIRRSIDAARMTGGRLFIVHMTSAEGIGLVAAAREEGLDVHAETCTHYLVFTEDMLGRDDGIKWICSPPLRTSETRDRLWEAVRDGMISQVSSDDAAYSWKAKLLGAGRFDLCPNGIPGVEVRLPLLYSEGVVRGRISLPRLVEVTAAAPARLFGLAPRKGSLEPGADADIVLLDPKAKWIMGRETLHMAADWSAYEGIPVTGKIVRVWSRGELIIDGEVCLGEKGRGRYLHRKLRPTSPTLDKRLTPR